MKKLAFNPGILLLIAAGVMLVINKKAAGTSPGGTTPPLTERQKQRLWLVNFATDPRIKNIFQSIMSDEEIDVCYVFYHDYNETDDYPDWLRNTMEVLNSKYNLFS